MGFWSQHAKKRGGIGPAACHGPDADGKLSWCTHIEASLAAAQPFAKQGGAEQTVENIHLLLKSKRPAIIYLAAINNRLRGIKPIQQLYQQMGERMMQSAEGIPHPEACIITNIPENLVTAQEFQDAVHLKQSQPMANVFADLIIAWLEKRQCLN